MLLNCKKCRGDVEALLDKDTQKIFCKVCDSEIVGISKFIKNMMESYGKVKKNEKFIQNGVLCRPCKKNTKPIKKENYFICEYCSKKLEINPIFEHYLKTKNQ